MYVYVYVCIYIYIYTIYGSAAGKSIISKETQRGSLCSRKPRNAGFRA